MSKGFRREFIKIDDVIYKYREEEDSWLKMTNITRGEDRRVSFDFDITKYKYNVAKAREEINTYWNNYKDSWTFFGTNYDNSHKLADYNMVKYRWSDVEHQNWFILPEIEKNAVHHFYTKWTDREGIEHSYSYNYYLVWHQGHIYWMVSYHYLPQCQLYKFEGIDKEPNKFVKWTHVKNLRAIWNKSLKKYA